MIRYLWATILTASFLSPLCSLSQQTPKPGKSVEVLTRKPHFILSLPKISIDSGILEPGGTIVALSGNKPTSDKSKRILNVLTPNAGTGTTSNVKVAGSVSISGSVVNTTCGRSNGSISVSGSGGTAPYTYSENGYPDQPTGNFQQLAAGSYTVTVTDAGGAKGTASFTITNQYAQPTINIYTYGGDDGCTSQTRYVTVAGSGGTPPYQYSIDMVNFQANPTFSNLSGGSYAFFVRDVNGCGNVMPFDLDPACKYGFGYSYTLYVCKQEGFFQTSGASGGTPPYQYSLDGGPYGSGMIFTGLKSGRHDFRIRDATGVEMLYSVPMYQSCPVIITAAVTDASCNAGDGSITASTSTGLTYEFSLDGINFQSSPVFDNLPAGTYTITARDQNGTVNELTGVLVGSYCPGVTAVSTTEICGDGTGKITATGKSGTEPYSFSIDGTTFHSSNVFPGLSAGLYTVSIRDAGGFTGTTTVTVQNTCIDLILKPADAHCAQDNGNITCIASGGTAPYTFSNGGIVFQPGSVFGNLAPGNYPITAKDVNGITRTMVTTIAAIPPPHISSTTMPAGCHNGDGSATAFGSGGTTPYQFAIDGGLYGAASSFSGLNAGNHPIALKDDLGCITTTAAIVGVNNDLSVDAGPDQTFCEGSGQTLMAVSNASDFAWSPAAGIDNSVSLHPVASPTVTTTYLLKASLGICEVSDAVTVNINPAPLADAGAAQTVCYGKSTTLHGSGGVRYEWSPAAELSDPLVPDPEILKPVSSANYALKVTDANGCSSLTSGSVRVTVRAPTVLFAGNDTVIAAGQPLQLNAVDINGSGFMQYQWSPATGLNNPDIANPVADIGADISYTVTGIAPGGCAGKGDINVKVYAGPAIYVPNAFTPNADGRNDVFKPIPVGITRLEYFAVFNRWGQRVFFSTEPGAGWNGFFNGMEQPQGTYVWMTRGTDYTGRIVTQKGTVVLLR